jgi:protein-S-isoprenylcysteine O-methyltransferase Ste14
VVRDETTRRSGEPAAAPRPQSLWLRTALFSLVVPGTVLVLIPAALVAGRVGPRLDLGRWRWIGLAPVAAGAAVVLRCFADFVRRGRGTPAPYDPPRELVVAGLYRHTRNPQYLGVLALVSGEALLTGAPVLLPYAAALALGYHLFVTCHEEPTLRRLFGDAYVRYCAAVPRWLPTRHRSYGSPGVPK